MHALSSMAVSFFADMTPRARLRDLPMRSSPLVRRSSSVDWEVEPCPSTVSSPTRKRIRRGAHRQPCTHDGWMRRVWKQNEDLDAARLVHADSAPRPRMDVVRHTWMEKWNGNQASARCVALERSMDRRELLQCGWNPIRAILCIRNRGRGIAEHTPRAMDVVGGASVPPPKQG
mmetsp:Transcript_1895/g.11511  ORF Transcript_1895/g.11511 Transcript_1895/m.11511 type:complete len:174 (+) Transcript_1895:3759-4280(+)